LGSLEYFGSVFVLRGRMKFVLIWGLVMRDEVGLAVTWRCWVSKEYDGLVFAAVVGLSGFVRGIRQRVVNAEEETRLS